MLLVGEGALKHTFLFNEASSIFYMSCLIFFVIGLFPLLIAHHAMFLYLLHVSLYDSLLVIRLLILLIVKALKIINT